MGNPYSRFQRPGMTHGLGPSPRVGSRSSSGPFGPLPSFGDVGFWYKADRDDAIWADALRTVPITDNTVIAYMDNLGLDTLDLAQSGGTRWRSAGGPGGSAYLQGISPSIGSAFPHAHPGSGPNGCSWFGVGRHPTAVGAQGTLGLYMTGFPQALFQTIPSGPPFIRGDLAGSGFETLHLGPATTNWYWAWASIDSAGNFNGQVSGQTLVSTANVYNPVPANRPVRLAASSSDFVESAFWPNYVFTAQDVIDIIAYLDSEYTGPFPLP